MYSSAVEHRIADPAVAGSIPAAPLITSFLKLFFSACVRVVGRSGTRVRVPVAQLDKASDYESEDWGFESLQG